MNDWFVNKMMEAHNEQRWDDRRNYAKAASVDFIKMIYFKEDENYAKLYEIQTRME